MHRTTSHLLWLASLSSLWSQGHCSPVDRAEPRGDGALSSNTDGSMIAEITSTPWIVNPGGPLLPTDTSLSFNPRGPMVPERPVSEPAATPMSVQPGGPLKPPHRREDGSWTTAKPTATALQAPGKRCTWTVSEQVPYPCSWNGIETAYPAIVTSTRYSDCHGCLDIQVDKQLWYCPNQIVSATAVVDTPKTIWTTACAPTTIPGQATAWAAAPAITSQAPTPSAPRNLNVPVADRRSPQGNLIEQQPAACPTTYVVQPGQSAGSTSTRYQQTVASTVRLPCGGCPLVLSTALAGYGPAGRFTTTITAPVETTTTYVVNDSRTHFGRSHRGVICWIPNGITLEC